MYRTEKWFPEPRQQKSWVTLPTELQVMIVKLMDLQASFAFRKCGPDQSFLVRKYKKFDVNIFVEFFINQRSIYVELRDSKSETVQFAWLIASDGLWDSKVEFFKSSSDILSTKVLTREPIGAATSKILQSLKNDPLFVFKSLNFGMNIIEETSNNLENLKNRVVSELGLSKLETYCNKEELLQDLLVNNCLKFESFKAPGIDKEWTRYVIQNMLYQKIEKKWPDIQELWRGYRCVFLMWKRFALSSEKASKEICEFLRYVPVFRNLLSLSWVLEKIQAKTTADTLMYFRAAYSHPDLNIQTYLKGTDPDYDENILCLKSGIDNGSLNGHQLSVLSIVYIVRLLRNEPVFKSITDTIHDCFRLILEEYSEFNYFEKLMAKIEILLPEIPAEVVCQS